MGQSPGVGRASGGNGHGGRLLCCSEGERLGCSAGQSWVLTRHRTHETCLAGGQRQEPSLRTAQGLGERLGQARGGLNRWGGGQVGEERVGLSSAPIPQACGATSWGPESTWNVRLSLECPRPWSSEQELTEPWLEISQGRDPRAPRWPAGQVIPWGPAAASARPGGHRGGSAGLSRPGARRPWEEKAGSSVSHGDSLQGKPAEIFLAGVQKPQRLR